jgi:hypothetical protein
MLIDSLSTLTPFEGGRYQWRACRAEGCPNVYKSNVGNSSELCPDCIAAQNPKAAAAEEALRKYHEGRKWNAVNRWKERWVIKHDPLPVEDGGLEPGVSFEALHFITTLAMGSWSSGLVAEYEGITYTVVCQNELKCADGAIYRVSNGMLKRTKPHASIDEHYPAASTKPAAAAKKEISYYQRRKAARAQTVPDAV